MPNERFNLPGGDWVDLATRLNHAQTRRIRRARYSESEDLETETVAAISTGWFLHDADGGEIPFPGGGPEGIPSAALDRVPEDVMTPVFLRCADIIAGEKDPKGGAGKSGGSARERTSGSSPT